MLLLNATSFSLLYKHSAMSITSVRDVDEPCYQEIVSRIYLGSCEAFKKDVITDKKITHVLSLGDFDNDLDVKIEYKVLTVS